MTNTQIYLQSMDAYLQQSSISVFSFDVTEGIVNEPVCFNGNSNLSASFGLKPPFSFDEFIRIACDKGFYFENNAGMVFRKKLIQKYKEGNPFYTTTFILTKSTVGRYRCFCMLSCPYASGHVFATVYVQKTARAGQGEDIEDYSQQLEVLNALSRDYHNIYITKFSEGLTKPVKLNGYILKGISEHQGEWFPYYELRERFVMDRVYEEDKEKFKELTNLEQLKQAFKEKNELVIAYRVLSDDVMHYYQARFIQMNDPDYFIQAFQNVDEAAQLQQQQEKALQEALVKAEKASEAKSTFLFNMSHDIRTPMNAIMGYTELLQQHPQNTDKTEDYLSKIRSSSEYLLSLINDVLEMARIENGKMYVDEVYVDAYSFNNMICSVFETEFKKKNITFVHELSVQHPYIYCDEVKVKEIILNLLSNALKYTLPGGTVKFSVSEIPLDDESIAVVKTVISDTGIGMSKEFLKHIFEDFSRERNSTQSGQKGTGLGMAIAYKLTNLMHGTLKVESEEGKGTIFTLLLPHRIAKDTVQQEKEEMTCDISICKGKRVLLAEDNDLNAEIAQVFLEDDGIIVDRAKDGIECLDLLEKHPPGYYLLIFMDIQMPNMDGYKATGILRTMDDQRYADIPVYAMTANAFEEDKRKAMEAGMNGHIAKPVEKRVIEKILCEEVKKSLQ